MSNNWCIKILHVYQKSKPFKGSFFMMSYIIQLHEDDKIEIIIHVYIYVHIYMCIYRYNVYVIFMVLVCAGHSTVSFTTLLLCNSQLLLQRSYNLLHHFPHDETEKHRGCVNFQDHAIYESQQEKKKFIHPLQLEYFSKSVSFWFGSEMPPTILCVWKLGLQLIVLT